MHLHTLIECKYIIFISHLIIKLTLFFYESLHRNQTTNGIKQHLWIVMDMLIPCHGTWRALDCWLEERVYSYGSLLRRVIQLPITADLMQDLRWVLQISPTLSGHVYGEVDLPHLSTISGSLLTGSSLHLLARYRNSLDLNSLALNCLEN